MQMMRIDYIPVVHDPARDVVQVEVRQDNGTPWTDFVMSWSNGFRAVAALAAVSLVVMMIGGI